MLRFNTIQVYVPRNFRRLNISSKAGKEQILFPEFGLSLRIELCPVCVARVSFAQWNSKNRFGKRCVLRQGTIRSDVKNAGIARWYRNAHSNSFRAYRHVATVASRRRLKCTRVEENASDVGGPLLLLHVHNLTLNDRAPEGYKHLAQSSGCDNFFQRCYYYRSKTHAEQHWLCPIIFAFLLWISWQ